MENKAAIQVGNPAVQVMLDLVFKFLRDNPQVVDFVVKQVMQLVENSVREAINDLIKEK